MPTRNIKAPTIFGAALENLMLYYGIPQHALQSKSHSSSYGVTQLPLCCNSATTTLMSNRVAESSSRWRCLDGFVAYTLANLLKIDVIGEHQHPVIAL